MTLNTPPDRSDTEAQRREAAYAADEAEPDTAYTTLDEDSRVAAAETRLRDLFAEAGQVPLGTMRLDAVLAISSEDVDLVNQTTACVVGEGRFRTLGHLADGLTDGRGLSWHCPHLTGEFATLLADAVEAAFVRQGWTDGAGGKAVGK